MRYRNQVHTTKALAAWYDWKYQEMGDGWNTPAEECNRHLDDLGVPVDKSLWLLDVGCGAGHFLVEAEKRVSTQGLEISLEGIKRCSDRGLRNVVLMSIETVPIDLSFGSFDFITSLGSLEHVVDLDTALDNIRLLLKPEGKFYFYCPNERWTHQDQPNERTMTDEEWTALFDRHGLHTAWWNRWGENRDNTAFCGTRDDAPTLLGVEMPK